MQIYSNDCETQFSARKTLTVFKGANITRVVWMNSINIPRTVTLKEQKSMFPESSVALHETRVCPKSNISWLEWEQSTVGYWSTLSVTAGSMVTDEAVDNPLSVSNGKSGQFSSGAPMSIIG